MITAFDLFLSCYAGFFVFTTTLAFRPQFRYTVFPLSTGPKDINPGIEDNDPRDYKNPARGEVMPVNFSIDVAVGLSGC